MTKTIGYICDNVPIELIEAAGLIARRIGVAPCRGVPLVDCNVRTALPFRPNRPTSSEGLLESLLNGTGAAIDCLVIVRGSDPIAEHYVELQIAARQAPQIKLPELYFLDRDIWPSDAATAFNRQSIAKFREQLETWSGTPIAAERLGAVIRRHNARRAAMRAVTRVRAEIAGSRALIAYAADAPAASAGAAPPLAPRLYLGGSEPIDPAFYHWVEAQGATITGEDHCHGQRQGEWDLPETGCPFAAIADRFDTQPGCSASEPLERRVARTVERARAARADAAILYVMRDDRLAAWEAPATRDALDAAGIPTLLVNDAVGGIAEDTATADAIAAFIGAQR